MRNQKFINAIYRIKIISQIKPGKIITNDGKPNWIGNNSLLLSCEQNLDKATTIPIIPSPKNNIFKWFIKWLKAKYQNKEILVEDIIKFHPIFEAIHPFSGRNGRLGRLLLTLFLRWLGLLKIFWFFFECHFKIKTNILLN